MEAEGLLHSTWERTSGGRSRRRYELSEHGHDMVDAYVAPVERLRGVAQEFLEMRKRGAGDSPELGAPRRTDSGPMPAANAAEQLSISAPRG